jgi:hypothetical protein
MDGESKPVSLNLMEFSNITPSFEEEPIESVGCIDALLFCLRLSGESISKVVLMGLSGEAFRFLYDRDDPLKGANTFFHNPLRASCTSLGYTYRISGDPSFDVAYEGLKEGLASMRKPGIIRCGDRWAVVVGYEGDGSALLIFPPSPEVRAVGMVELEKLWPLELGFLELGPLARYWFILGEKEREPVLKDMYHGALRRGLRMMRFKKKIEGCSVGIMAFEELLSSLSRKKRYSELPYESIIRLGLWNTYPLSLLLSGRRSLVRFLEIVYDEFFGEEWSPPSPPPEDPKERERWEEMRKDSEKRRKEMSESILKAIRLCKEQVKLLDEMRLVHPAVGRWSGRKDTLDSPDPEERKRAISSLKSDRKRAAKIAKRLWSLEYEMSREIEKFVWKAEVERTRRW